MSEKKVTFKVKNMVCASCEEKVCKAASAVDGVTSCNASPGRAVVSFDEERTDREKIAAAIESAGYPCPLSEKPAKFRTILLFSLFFLGGFLLNRNGLAFPELSSNLTELSGNFPELSGNLPFFLLFTVGLLTGFHCIGMCGGFVLSYAEKATMKSHLLYSTGKTISYTIIGGLFGLLGSFVAFTPGLRGAAALFSGLFLVAFGLKMLGFLRFRINLPSVQRGKGPLGIGLLNGLMIACGPLQAMYIYAAGTGSIIRGATSLFAFGLGTLPAMLGFGTFASTMSKLLANRIAKASGVLVILLGLGMANTGLSLAGTGYDARSLLSTKASETAFRAEGYQEIYMEVLGRGYEPNSFVLEKGVPVRWRIDAKELNYCNDTIMVPGLGLEFDLLPGEQVIEFTPEAERRLPWSCWMGMMPGSFIVAEKAETVEPERILEQPVPTSSCPGTSPSSSSGCSCGGV